MNADSILNHIVTLVTPSIHRTRRTAVKACIRSLMQGANGSVTSIGRGICSTAYEKHNIKRADRLLFNPLLLEELPLIYRALCQWLGLLSSQPIIHVDWSDLDPNKRHFLIRASLLFSGRSLTLYQEVHDITTKEKPQTHQAFLSQLATFLGDDVTPIIVTDAGFKVPWFRQVLSLNWHYVGRVRKPNFYKTKEQNWRCISHLYPSARSNAQAFNAELCRSNSLHTQLVLFKEKAKGRRSLGCLGQKKMNSNDRKYSRGATDPWLLATSLPNTSNLAKRSVNIYHSRMQIEEAFRDMKSHQFGLGYMVSKSKKRARVSILVMLVSLANFILIMIGLSVDTAGNSRRYQANTVKHKRVLSFHTLGVRAVRSVSFKLALSKWKATLSRLNDYVQGADYDVI
jgi:hypothetical protein